MSRIILAIILTGLVPYLSDITLVLSENYCYSKDSKPYHDFAFRTAYEHVHARNLSIPSNCKIRYIWALIRHGTRYGSSRFHSNEAAENVTKIKNQIIENHEVRKRGKLCEEDLKNLKNWTHQWTSKIPMELTQQGINDMKGIASRLKNKFNFYFNDFETKFVIQTTSRSRCQQSAMAFINELFGTSYTTIVGNNITINNQLLYIAFDNVSDDVYQSKFSNTSTVKNMINEIGERLGYESKLTFKFVEYLYTYCAYENAWVVNSRPGFCVVFSPEHLKIMEYFEDVVDFHELGPFNQINKMSACPIVRDLYEKVIAAANNSENSQKGTFYFGHEETLLPVLVHLRLFQNEVPLRYDNYEFLSNRKWRTSYISPFGANLYVILFRCRNEFKISFYNNEKQILIPGCVNSECTIEEFQDIFENRILKDCMENRSMSSIPSTVLLILNLFLFVNCHSRNG